MKLQLQRAYGERQNCPLVWDQTENRRISYLLQSTSLAV